MGMCLKLKLEIHAVYGILDRILHQRLTDITTYGKVLGTIFGNVDVITLGIDVGTDMGSLDVSFDGSNDDKRGGLLL